MKTQRDFKTDTRPIPIIIQSVCKALEVKPRNVISKNRNREYSEARFIIFYLLKYHALLTLKQIGPLIGGRNFTTVHYGLETFKELTESRDRAFLRKIEKVKKELPELVIINT
ncbi:helix-turn-helix domain-containing protein [Pedobacter cryoconitis]|uniref:Chromosomal replication initiation ATPase DnaA n=1 Tax=Pedobacter cryoconitis TaxID=188932 RepID=A0A7X0MHH2_9SPHI|nr:helix-turn-helix domain-containing protein [Pedobacter cryoconitis]MBB6499129.1 chromosomal replication initiation ATPase DnaA [Pedobacter cryoconitis]